MTDERALDMVRQECLRLLDRDSPFAGDDLSCADSICIGYCCGHYSALPVPASSPLPPPQPQGHNK